MKILKSLHFLRLLLAGYPIRFLRIYGCVRWRVLDQHHYMGLGHRQSILHSPVFGELQVSYHEHYLDGKRYDGYSIENGEYMTHKQFLAAFTSPHVREQISPSGPDGVGHGEADSILKYKDSSVVAVDSSLFD